MAALLPAASGRASDSLPFDPAQICRYSVDNIPRSISIRQGADVWFGYDLEKALVFKVWKAPAGKPGVLVKSFKAQSSGTTLFEAKPGDAWQIKVDGKDVPLSARYLGCIQDSGNFELSWELSCPEGTVKLTERIAMAPASGSSQVQRRLRIESLPGGASLLLPEAYRKAWDLTDPDGTTVSSLTGPAWYQLSLP